EPLRERLAVDQLEHHEVQLVAAHARAADVVDRADVRVVERGDALRLALEARAELRVGRELRGQQLDGHVPLESRVTRLVDLAHPPRTERSADLVRPEAGGRREYRRGAGAAHGCPPRAGPALRRKLTTRGPPPSASTPPTSRSPRAPAGCGRRP